jgi:hypothetical protein
MNGLDKLNNNKKTVDKKNIIKICESDDDDDNNNNNDIVSVGSDKKKCDDKCDGDKKDSDVKNRTRYTKEVLYKEERIITLNKINNILGVNNENHIFYIYDIENDIEKQKIILELQKDIGKFFKGKSTALFTKDNSEKRWLSIIKIIYKEMKIEMEYGSIHITRNGIKIKSSFYKINNKLNEKVDDKKVDDKKVDDKKVDDKKVDDKKVDDKKVDDKKVDDKKVDDNSIEKNIGGRPKKAELFKKERLEILNNLNNILGITKNNNTFYIYDINEHKQKTINNMIDSIKKYFKGKSNAIFSKEGTDRIWLCIIKIIYKEMNIKMIHSNTVIIRNNNKIKSGFYTLIDPITL